MRTQIEEGNFAGPNIARSRFADIVSFKPLDSSLRRDCYITERQLRYTLH